VVTTAADLTVVPTKDGITIIYVVDSEVGLGKNGLYGECHLALTDDMVLAVVDLDVCFDRGRNLDHLRNLVPIIVRDTACAYLYIHSEDESFRVYLRPTTRLDVTIQVV